MDVKRLSSVSVNINQYQMAELGFTTINYRNGVYQGQVLQSQYPHGEGIFIDDHLTFTLGTWNQGILHGNTLVFQSHSKYIYGSWQRGLPEGVNVYREGSNVLISNYKNGQMIGKLLVVCEDKGLMVVYEIQRGIPVFVRLYEEIKEENIQEGLRGIGVTEDMMDLLSLIRFIDKSYQLGALGLSISTHNNLNFIGVNKGLGLLFNDDNFIYKIGVMSSDKQIRGIGGSYTFNESREGDFQANDIVVFKNQRPQEEVKRVIKRALLKSFNFRNQYLLTETHKAMQYIGEILRIEIFSQIAHAKSQSKMYSMEDLNESLDYHPRDQNDQLKKMRAELYLSIGRPGSQIQPLRPEIVKEFIETEHNERRLRNEKDKGKGRQKENLYQNPKSRKPSTHNLTSNTDPYSYPSPLPNPNQVYSKYQISLYKRDLSPVKQYSKSKPKANLSKYDKIQQPTWIKDTKRMVTQVRLSRSPLKKRTSISPNRAMPQLKTLSSLKNTVTFGNTSLKRQIVDVREVEIRESEVKEVLGSRGRRKHDDLNLLRSSPEKRIKVEEDAAYGSPYKNIGESQQNPHLKSTEIKTISRRIDKPDPAPRSSFKYNYISSLDIE